VGQFPWTNFDFIWHSTFHIFIQLMPTLKALIYFTITYGQPQRERQPPTQPFSCTIQVIHLLFLHYVACGGTTGWGTVLQASRSGVQFLLHRADNLTHLHVSNVLKSKSFNLLEPSGPVEEFLYLVFIIHTQESHLSQFSSTLLVLWVLKSSIPTSHIIRFTMPSVPGFSKSQKINIFVNMYE
jgi:hypothetical protein